MILKGLELAYHFTHIYNFLFSWDHCISIGTQGKSQQKELNKITKFDPNLGYKKLSKLVLHIQC
jgi:hypothetical protein